MIYFRDWTIEADCEVIARQYDNKSRTLSVIGDLPDGWEWDMLVEVDGNLNILRLTPDFSGASVLLTSEMLCISGAYRMQLRGTQGEMVRHTNQIDVYIPESMTGDAQWVEIPSEFTQLEARLNAILEEVRRLSGTYPIIGDNGNWFIGGVDTGFPSQGVTPHIGENGHWYIGDTDTGVSAGGGGTGNVYSQDVTAIRVLNRADYDAMETHDAKTLYLITG